MKAVIFLLSLASLSFGQDNRSEQLFDTATPTANSILISLRPFTLEISSTKAAGQTFQDIRVPGFDELAVAGRPALPALTALLNVPENAEISVQIVRSEFEEIDGIVPRLVSFPEDEDASASRTPGSADSNDRYWPAEAASFEGVGLIRGYPIARIVFHPVQYQRAQNKLRVLRQLEVLVKWSGPVSQSGQGGKDDSIFSRTIAGSVLNPLQWRMRPSADIVQPGWYNPDLIYAKLKVTRTGVYGVSYRDLLDAGVAPADFDLASIKLINRGVEVPIRIVGPQNGTFGPDNRVIFYGERNASSSRYYDLYSDTNVYWLTSDSNPSRRYQQVDLPPETSPHAFYWQTLHLEEEHILHRSNKTSEVDADEGWVWRYLFPDETAAINFTATAPSPDVSSYSLKLRLNGTTLDPVTPDHHVTLSLNGSALGDRYFDDQEELIWELDFPPALLQWGNNTLTLKLVDDTGASVNQIFLDWVEIAYARQYAASENVLTFRNPSAPAGSSVFRLVNFADPALTVLQPESGRIWKPAATRQSVHRVESAGFDDGIYMAFFSDIEYFPLAGTRDNRGYNIMAIQPPSGERELRHFDTFSGPEQVNAMAAYLNQLPGRTVILAGILDEGSSNMNEQAYSAFEAFGSSHIRELAYRDSWAFIGWKGAQPNEVKEVLAPHFSGPAIVSDTLYEDLAFRFTGTFSDTASGASHPYVAVSDSGIRRVDAIALERPSRLAEPSNGADYLIISHRNFVAEAERLAGYRRDHNGFRTMVVDIEDIYDEFNHGITHASAIKDFITYAFRMWQAPAPSYVLLLGDATIDPRNNMPESVKFNFIPTYGEPVADNWFVSLDGPDDALPDLFIGRIPAETAEQARVVIDKIVSYEMTEYGPWNKKLAFLNGGINSSEQNIFLSQANILIEDHVEDAPFRGIAKKFNKTTGEGVTLLLRNDITALIREGLLWINFIGHAGSNLWDIDMGEPDSWQNDILPFVTGMSCHSARFANSVINSLAEEYFMRPDGVAAYWGSSGFGYVSQDFFLLDGLFPAVTKDGVRSVGEATTLAKLSLWQRLGDQQRNRDVINQYPLIGDPAMRLALSVKPELAIRDTDIDFAADYLLLSDSTATIKVRVQNYGPASADSVAVLLRAFSLNGAEVWTDNRLLPPVGTMDSLTAVWPIPATPGRYRVEVQIDPFDAIEEESNLNNVASREIEVFSSELSLLRPLPFGVLRADEILYTNNSRAGGHDVSYFFELDTTSTFTSSSTLRSGQMAEAPFVTAWQPEIVTPGVYFWRARTFDGSNYSQWESSSFAFMPGEDAEWYQSHHAQFEKNPGQQTQVGNSGVTLAITRFEYQAESAGFLDGNYAALSINNKLIGRKGRGHNLAAIDDAHGKVVADTSFDTFGNMANADAMARFVADLPEGLLVLVAISDEGSSSMTEAAYQAMESLGSQYTRQVGLRDSWAMIGRKGASPGSVPEIWKKAGEGPVVIADTLSRFAEKGVMRSVEIGPALQWRTAHFVYHANAETGVSFQILGRNRTTGTLDTLLANIKAGTQDLSAIDAAVYRKLQLEAVLESDNGLDSPSVRSWSVDYALPPDLILDRRSVHVTQDTVQAGQDILMSVNVGNFGFDTSGRFAIRVTAAENGRPPQEAGRLWSGDLAVAETQEYDFDFSTEGLSGRLHLTAEIDPDDAVPEIYESNNSASLDVHVVQDTLSPQIQVTFDGQLLADNDFVASAPAVVVALRDLSSISQSDTGRVTILLDQNRVPYGPLPGQAQILPQQEDTDPELQALILFSPSLASGEHTLQILARDAVANLGFFEASFFVSDAFSVNNVMNYPNPFAGMTEFTYMLTQPADHVRMKVYTISGHLVLTMDDLPAGAGFNQFQWDGRDRSGDALANGVYLYKLIVRKEEQQMEVLEKFVVMR